jgi:predicted Zn-dependent protease with MMP-like domain
VAVQSRAVALSKAEQRVLDHLVREADDLLTRGEVEKASQSLTEAEAMDPDHPDVLRLRAELLYDAGDDGLAEDRLRRVIAVRPDDADAHHLLATILGDRDDFDGMVRHNLEVLRIDMERDRKAGIGSGADVAFIEELCHETLEQIPEPFRSKLEGVPVVLEARPSVGHVGTGFDPRAVGMFEGSEDGHNGVADRPTRIVVFYANLIATCVDDDEIEAQVEITLLHEIGHFFGLDEDGVAALGLE